MNDDRPHTTARRPRLAIAASFGLAVLGVAGFAATYALGGQPQFEGVALGVAFGGLAGGLVIWARHLLPSGGYVEHTVRQLSQTAWRTGTFRLVDRQNRPVRLTDVAADTIIIVFPEGHTSAGDVPSFVVRLDPRRFTARPLAGDISGVVAYSLLCTHAGCPVTLFEQSTGRILCPCHQSVFDLLNGARPVAGPAARPLPVLPITVDAAGFLRATGDFTGPPGPGYWSRP